jgi:hypothetical protein
MGNKRTRGPRSRTVWQVGVGLVIAVLLVLLFATMVQAYSSPHGWTRSTSTTASGTSDASLSGGNLYQESDQNLSYSGSWRSNNGNSYSGGGAVYAFRAGTSVTVDFSGTSLTWLAKTASSCGKAQVTLDGGSPVTVDLYSSSTRYQQAVYNTGTLANGTHSLTISWTGQKNSRANGTYVYIDAFQVAGTLVGDSSTSTTAPSPTTSTSTTLAPTTTTAPSTTTTTAAATTTTTAASSSLPSPSGGTTRYEETDPNLAYSGHWYNLSGSGYSDGSLAYASSAGASVALSFTGTGLTLIAKTGPSYGLAQVTLDGKVVATVDLYNPTNLNQQAVWSSGTLPNATHTLVIECLREKNASSAYYYVDLDALDIAGTMAQYSPDKTSTTSSTTTTSTTTTTTVPPGTSSPTTPTTTSSTTSTTLASGQMVNVKNYGAKGDGITDDGAAIAAALKACASGQTLYFPAGTYYVAGSVICKAGVNMTGDGDGRGGKTSWIKGQVKTAPYVNLTDLKMGRELSTNYFGFGTNATHDMTVTRCTFTGGPLNGGVISYIGVDCYNLTFQDCVIAGDPANHNRDGVALTNYGQANARMYNIDFRNCTFKSGGRIGFEITSRWDGVHDYVYPIRNVNLINCTFEPMGASGISWGMTSPSSSSTGPGVWTDGYSTISGCTIEDAGTYSGTNAGTHGIELAGPVHMTVTGNTIRGSHVRTMLSMTNATDNLKFNGSGLLRTYNNISGNTFDGSQSPYSTFDLRTSNFSLTNNTFVCRATGSWCTIQNASDATITGNTFKMLDSATGSTYSADHAALYVLGTDNLDFENNNFWSKFSYTVVFSQDSISPVLPSTNNVVKNNTFHKGSTNKPIYVGSGSSATETGSTYLGI